MTNTDTVRVSLVAESLSTDERLREANARKTQGNDYFRKSDWEEALAIYQSAVAFLPKSHAELIDKPSDSPSNETREEEIAPSQNTQATTPESAPEHFSPETEKACAALRSALNANIGACYVKLGEHKQAVEACTRALVDDPNYVKVLQRRAASNEIINTWSSLSSAQEDYNALLKLLPPGAETRQIEGKLRSLKPRVEAAQSRETAEMLDKLKGLGNNVLGRFGLSTDNFKFEPNGQGGYSLNFAR